MKCIGYSPYHTYMEMADVSEGFDVGPGAGRRLCGGIAPFDDKLDPVSFKDAIKVAKYAVEHHNKTQNDNLEFVELAKANGQSVGGYMYYLTLKARRPSHKRPRIYQAKVWSTVSSKLHVDIFRLRPKHYPYKLSAASSSVKKTKPMKLKPLTVPKGAFLHFMNHLSKLPELSTTSYSDVATLASTTWKSMSTAEKVRYYLTRSLEYKDILRSQGVKIPDDSDSADSDSAEE